MITNFCYENKRNRNISFNFSLSLSILQSVILTINSKNNGIYKTLPKWVHHKPVSENGFLHRGSVFHRKVHFLILPFWFGLLDAIHFKAILIVSCPLLTRMSCHNELCRHCPCGLFQRAVYLIQSKPPQFLCGMSRVQIQKTQKLKKNVVSSIWR